MEVLSDSTLKYLYRFNDCFNVFIRAYHSGRVNETDLVLLCKELISVVNKHSPDLCLFTDL